MRYDLTPDQILSLAAEFLRDVWSAFQGTLVKGEVRTLHTTGAAVYRGIRAGRRYGLHGEVGAERFTNSGENKKTCLPRLALGLDGLESAQESYEKTRLVVLSSMPGWVSQECTQIAKDNFNSVLKILAKKGWKSALTKSISASEALVGQVKIDKLMLDVMPTYFDLRALHTEAVLDNRGEVYRYGKDMTCDYSLASLCPYGEAARKALEKCSEFMLSARIALDLCDIYAIPFEQDEVHGIAKRAQYSPWELSSYEPIQRFMHVMDLLQQDAIDLSAQEKREAARGCLYNGGSIVAKAIIKKRAHLSKEHTQARELVASNSSETIEVRGMRNVVIDELCTHIKKGDAKNRREYARELYKYIRRELASLDDVVKKLSSGVPYDRVLREAQVKEAELKSILSSTGPERRGALSVDQRRQFSGSTKTAPQYSVSRSDNFNSWLNSIDTELEKKRVVARIERLTQGHLGDFKFVRGAIIELRQGNGTRIYCIKTSANSFHILLGGDKDSQGRDIQACLDTL
jgi:putative addiction module killer protein